MNFIAIGQNSTQFRSLLRYVLAPVNFLRLRDRFCNSWQQSSCCADII